MELLILCFSHWVEATLRLWVTCESISCGSMSQGRDTTWHKMSIASAQSSLEIVIRCCSYYVNKESDHLLTQNPILSVKALDWKCAEESRSFPQVPAIAHLKRLLKFCNFHTSLASPPSNTRNSVKSFLRQSSNKGSLLRGYYVVVQGSQTFM